MIFCLGLIGLFDFKTCQECKKYISNILLKILQIIPAHGAGYMLVSIMFRDCIQTSIVAYPLSPHLHVSPTLSRGPPIYTSPKGGAKGSGATPHLPKTPVY